MGFAFIGPRDDMEYSQKTLRALHVDSEIVGEVGASDDRELVTYLHQPGKKDPIPFRGYSA